MASWCRNSRPKFSDALRYHETEMTRREILNSMAAAAIAARSQAAAEPLTVEAGPDRIVVLNGRTYLRGWAAHGKRPHARDPWEKQPPQPPPAEPGTKFAWTKIAGPGEVKFANPAELVTTATFSKPGAYTLGLSADNGQAKASSTLDRLGRAAAAPAAARSRLHEELPDRQPALERPRQGADGQLDSPLHRRHQPHRRHARRRAASTTSSRPARSCAASRTARTRATSSPTPGSTRPSRR